MTISTDPDSGTLIRELFCPKHLPPTEPSTSSTAPNTVSPGDPSASRPAEHTSPPGQTPAHTPARMPAQTPARKETEAVGARTELNPPTPLFKATSQSLPRSSSLALQWRPASADSGNASKEGAARGASDEDEPRVRRLWGKSCPGLIELLYGYLPHVRYFGCAVECRRTLSKSLDIQDFFQAIGICDVFCWSTRERRANQHGR